MSGEFQVSRPSGAPEKFTGFLITQNLTYKRRAIRLSLTQGIIFLIVILNTN